MKSFIGSVVQRYLGSRRGFTRVVTIFSVLGILLGVAALLIVMAVMSGFRQELMGRILGVTGHVTIEVAEMNTHTAELIAQELGKVQGVVSVSPYVSGQVMISANGRAGGAYVRGVIKHDDIPFIAEKMVIGEPDSIETEGKILIGENLAGNLGMIMGGAATLLSPDGARTVMGFVPRTSQIQVGGIFKIGMVQFDSGLIIMNMADAQRLFKRGDRVQALEVKLSNPDRVYEFIPEMWKILERFVQPQDVQISTWQSANADFFRALQIERVTMFIILSLIVLVAAFNIITGQMMLVNDKLADIAILRTMGATQGDVLKVFFYNGMLLGGMGTLGGFWIGMLIVFNMRELVGWLDRVMGVQLFASDVYFLSELPSKLSFTDVGAVLGMSVLLTVLASLYPAYRASRMNPVELLRRG